MTAAPRFVAAIMLLLTFAVGGLVGMALEEGLGLDWFDFLDEDNRGAETRLFADLDLSAEQRQRIERILDLQEERLEEYWESRIPDLRSIVAESYEEIGEVLTPGQRATFDGRVEEQGIALPRDPD